MGIISSGVKALTKAGGRAIGADKFSWAGRR